MFCRPRSNHIPLQFNVLELLRTTIQCSSKLYTKYRHNRHYLNCIFCWFQQARFAEGREVLEEEGTLASPALRDKTHSLVSLLLLPSPSPLRISTLVNVLNQQPRVFPGRCRSIRMPRTEQTARRSKPKPRQPTLPRRTPNPPPPQFTLFRKMPSEIGP